MAPLTQCKPQLPHIWKEFNAFVSRSGRYVDLRDIDLLLLIDFEKALPRLGWSPTAVHLIEALLIVVFRYLHQQKILYGYFSEPLKRTPLAPIFPISIPDFRTIKSRYVQQANDYEVSYFDLITTYSKFRHALQKITGGDVRFEHHRGFITLDRVYRQITVGKKFRSYVVPYSPHSILVALVSCRQLSHDDRINPQGGTI